MVYYNRCLKQIARVLRKNMTQSERLLWSRIRRKQLKDRQFYRQKIIGNYIVDFYCPDCKLAVEVDGGQHDLPEERDADVARTRFLEDEGLKVVRFWNSQVRENLPWVLELIRWEVARSITPHPGPLPQGERE